MVDKKGIMTWEIIKHKDGKIDITVTGDEIIGIIPPEVDELVQEHNKSISSNENCHHDKIDIEQYFTKDAIYTFYISSDDIIFKEI